MSDEFKRGLDNLMVQARREHEAGVVHRNKCEVMAVVYRLSEAESDLAAVADTIRARRQALPLHAAPEPQIAETQRPPLPHEIPPAPPPPVPGYPDRLKEIFARQGD